jgi:hypothetical protein
MPLRGTDKALMALVNEADSAGADDIPEQLPLLPGPLRDAPEPERARRRGQNRNTREMVEYLRSRYRHPLEVLAQTWSRPTAELALEIGCSTQAAFELQQRAAVDSLPYWQSRQPLALVVSEAQLVPFQVIDPRPLAAAGAAAHGVVTIEAQEIDAAGNPINSSTSPPGSDDVGQQAVGQDDATD